MISSFLAANECLQCEELLIHAPEQSPESGQGVKEDFGFLGFFWVFLFVWFFLFVCLVFFVFCFFFFFFVLFFFLNTWQNE